MFLARTIWQAVTDLIKSAWACCLPKHVGRFAKATSHVFIVEASKDTGFVRKSLQPAASAETLSDCDDDTVKATTITEEWAVLEDMRESLGTSN